MSRLSERNEFEQPADSGRQPQPDTVRRPESDSQERDSRGASSGAAELQRDHVRDSEPIQRRPVEPRTPYRNRHWTYSLRTSEIQTLRELGTFRSIDSEALAEIGYRGDRDRMEQDLRNLI